MLVRPEQVVPVAMHGGALMGNLRRAGKKGKEGTHTDPCTRAAGTRLA